MKHVELIFGVTPARCYFAEEELGVPHNKIRLLPIGADEDGANDVLAGLKLQEHTASSESNGLKIVTGGKWFKGKGLEELDEAVEGFNVRLKIFGRADDYFERYYQHFEGVCCSCLF
ncbi:hypothetical protein [Mesotoga sp.]|jgi:hypothetical protein|uniref:hypothetical protein n=1 Tax=Mesotoga sp. TaxID=2053577 RepID=UPI00345E10A8